MNKKCLRYKYNLSFILLSNMTNDISNETDKILLKSYCRHTSYILKHTKSIRKEGQKSNRHVWGGWKDISILGARE